MALALGSAAVCATFVGGVLALFTRARLHLILGFSAGAVLGVALFDLLPESFELARATYAPATVALCVGLGFFAFVLLNRMSSTLGPASLSLHSFLDGVGIGLAFKVSVDVGVVVAAAVLAHDFADGVNTVAVVLRRQGRRVRALRWLALDAAAPLLGVASTSLFTLTGSQLGLVLALFCGFFLFIGASDLLPESHRRRPAVTTGALNVAGAAVIWLTIHLAAL